MSTWLVIGSSPSAESGIAAARQDWTIDATITTNRGIFLEPKPDVYVLADYVAFREFGDIAQRARLAGTRLVAVAYHIGQRSSCDSYDEYIEVKDFISSGITCLWYAANRADRVILVGCDGYVAGVDPYFKSPHMDSLWLNGGLKDHSLATMTERQIRPGTQRIVDGHPDVQFEAYGKLNYMIDAPNWHVHELVG